MSTSFTKADYAAIITNYTPTSVRPPVWEHVASFTRNTVFTFDPDPESLSRDGLRNLLNCVARLSAWVWTNYGVVSIDTVFHPEVIRDFFTVTGPSLSRSTAGTQRSLLYRVGQKVNPEWISEYSRPIAYGPNLSPYDQHDVARYWDWAVSQPTVARRRNFVVVLGLTLGAGLRAGEICTLKGRDIRVDRDGMLVYPHGFRGAPAREVPLLCDWHEILSPHTDSVGDDEFVFRPGRDNDNVGMLSAYLRRVTPNTSPDLVPDTRRLRNTWIVGRINAGVPADVLCAAAGLKSLHQFEDYVAQAGAQRAHNFRRLLSGGSSGGTGLHAL